MKSFPNRERLEDDNWPRTKKVFPLLSKNRFSKRKIEPCDLETSKTFITEIIKGEKILELNEIIYLTGSSTKAETVETEINKSVQLSVE